MDTSLHYFPMTQRCKKIRPAKYLVLDFLEVELENSLKTTTCRMHPHQYTHVMKKYQFLVASRELTYPIPGKALLSRWFSFSRLRLVGYVIVPWRVTYQVVQRTTRQDHIFLSGCRDFGNWSFWLSTEPYTDILENNKTTTASTIDHNQPTHPPILRCFPKPIPH